MPGTPFTSAQTGNWDDGASWGNTSPGVKGTDWPGTSGDVVTVTAGHTITYNVSETNALGVLTVNGVLSFSTSMSTKLTFGHVDLIIGATGQVLIGSAGTPLNKAYTAEIIWATTSDNAKGFNVNDGGQLKCYGDPTYYGSSYKTTLASSWTTGQTLTVTGDYTAKWNVGDALTVHKYALYSSYNTDVALVTIASMALNGTNTNITINEAFPGGTFNTGGHVNNPIRNVKFSMSGANTAIGQYNANRPRIYDVNAQGNNNCVLSNVLMTGFAEINSKYEFQFLDSVFRNGKGYVPTNWQTYGHTISGLIYSCGGANLFYYGRGHNVSAEIYSTSNDVFITPKNYVITGDIYACNRVINSGVDDMLFFGCELFSNSTAIGGGQATFENCAIYYNAVGIESPGGNRFINCNFSYKPDGTLAANTTDVGLSGGLARIFTAYGGKWKADPVIGGPRGSLGHTAYLAFQDYNGVTGDHRIYGDVSTTYRETSIVRPGGASDSIKVEPYSAAADKYNPIRCFEWDEVDVPALAQTRSVFIRGYGWSAFPSNTELYLEAEYISDATTYAHTIVKSTTVLTDNTTWVEFPVTFTPAVQGPVRYRVYLKKYQASSGIYIDNKLY